MIEKGSKLKAKCPNCKEGCDKCLDGYIEVAFGKEDEIMYSLICNKCGGCAGGGFSTPDKINLNKVSKYAICPICGEQDLKKVIE